MNSFLFSNATAKDLGILRCTIFAIWLIIIAFTPLTNYSLLPAELFNPLGVYRLLFSASASPTTQFVLSYPFLLGLKIVLILGCTICMVGIRPFKWFAIPTVLLLFLCDGIVKGFNGFVNHAEMGILYGALIISLFPAADNFSLKKTKMKAKDNAHYIFPILLLSVIVFSAYSYVGIYRLLHGGFDIFSNDALLIHLLVNSSEYTKYSMDLGLAVANSDFFLNSFKVGFLVITIFELLSPLVILSRYFCIAWLAVMIPFHLLSLLAMNIFFWENLTLFLLLGVYTIKKGSPNEEPF